jgi:uncharacterized membrane protein
MSKTIVVAVAVTAVVFLALDGIWLGFVSRGLYQREIGPLLLESPRLGVAAAFYLLYIIGLVYFCVMPGVAEQSVLRGLVNGAFFGVIAYATYDLTNLATLKGWSEMLVFIDIAWGCFASALASAAGAGAAVRVAATG